MIKNTKISVSILSFYFEAKKNNFSDTKLISNINGALKKRRDDFDILHFDIGDGVFIDSKTFTSNILRKINCDKKKEAHLMVVDYNKYLKDYLDVADMFIVHNEVLKHDFEKTINFLKKNNKYVGISINPDTSVNEIKYLDKINLVLVMSVHPGLPGQEFIESSLLKVKKLYEIRKNKNLKYSIAIDGGINKNNMEKCISVGADILVMGTGFFKEETLKKKF
ncbi:MAG: ribulose-phosphate 3-epimerase [Candidatus Woesearchaeota archaeon]